MSQQQADVRVHVQTMRLGSTNPDRSLRFPAPQALTWLQLPHMPAVLVKMEDAPCR